MQNNGSKELKKALIKVKKFMDTHELMAPLLTINS